MGYKWTCETCEHWDDGYCCVRQRWCEDDDYCDRWSDAYDEKRNDD